MFHTKDTETAEIRQLTNSLPAQRKFGLSQGPDTPKIDPDWRKCSIPTAENGPFMGQIRPPKMGVPGTTHLQGLAGVLILPR